MISSAKSIAQLHNVTTLFNITIIIVRNTVMAALVSCCFGCCEDNNRGHVTLKEMPTVQLDTHHMGKCCDLTFQTRERV